MYCVFLVDTVLHHNKHSCWLHSAPGYDVTWNEMEARLTVTHIFRTELGNTADCWKCQQRIFWIFVCRQIVRWTGFGAGMGRNVGEKGSWCCVDDYGEVGCHVRSCMTYWTLALKSKIMMLWQTSCGVMWAVTGTSRKAYLQNPLEGVLWQI